jgi:hypothetical protein
MNVDRLTAMASDEGATLAEPLAPPSAPHTDPFGTAPVDAAPDAAAPVPGVPAPAAGRSGGAVSIAVWVVVVAAIAIGVALRAWYLFHRPITSDEAIAGLMARQAAVHGQFTAFYWGQFYGGVEPYLIGLRYAVFGFSSSQLGLVTTLLAAGSGLLTWRVARRLVDDRALAALAGAVAWSVPAFAMYTSTYEWGFRGVTLFCGVLLILLCLRVLDGSRRLVDFVGLGLTAGVGWWSSPEIAYFAIPAGLLLVQSFLADREDRRVVRWLWHLLTVAVGVVVGALPWIWANARSGLESLNQSSARLQPGYVGFGGRLRLFFHYSLGMLLSLRGSVSGRWLFAPSLSIALLVIVVAVLAAAVVLCLLRGGRQLALACGVAAFPFLAAVLPNSWFWEDGRYVGYVVPLYVLVLIMGCVEASRRLRPGRRAAPEKSKSLGRALAAGAAAVLLALTVANFATFAIPNESFFAGWTNPDGPTLSAIAKLEAAGVQDGYADYWVAYRVDFLSGDKINLTVVGSDPDRWQAQHRTVDRSKAPAWIFVPPDPAGLAQFAGTPLIVGPANITQAQFEADLHRLGIGYRVVDAGLIHAVIPDRAVPLKSVGVPASG